MESMFHKSFQFLKQKGLQHQFPISRFLYNQSRWIRKYSSQSTDGSGTEYTGPIPRGQDEFIPVPWGVLGAKKWGSPSPSKKPILCIHGWKDNLASFDRLIPLLLLNEEFNRQYYLVAIDLPGHGFSSHFPPGMMYHIDDCIICIARIMRHYGWTHFNYIGHSLGSILGFMFCGTNHGIIDRFVAIDALTPIIFRNSEVLDLVPTLIDEALKFEKKLQGSPPLYSYEEIFSRHLNSHMGGLDELSSKTLLSRGIVESEPGSGKFHFTHDIRVKYLPVMLFNSRQVSYIAKNFRSSLLHIRAIDGVGYERPYIRQKVQSWINHYKPETREVQFINLEGGHHLHLRYPERIVEQISDFLLRGNNEKERKTK